MSRPAELDTGITYEHPQLSTTGPLQPFRYLLQVFGPAAFKNPPIDKGHCPKIFCSYYSKKTSLAPRLVGATCRAFSELLSLDYKIGQTAVQGDEFFACRRGIPLHELGYNLLEYPGAFARHGSGKCLS